MTETRAPEFKIMSWGLVHASVCTSYDLLVATVQLNLQLPTGIASPWRKSADPTFSGGEPNGMPCPDQPETHRHWLFSC